jgi:hypothetical protein
VVETPAAAIKINNLADIHCVRDEVLKGSELSSSGGWKRDRAFVRCVFQNALARPLRSLRVEVKSAAQAARSG